MSNQTTPDTTVIADSAALEALIDRHGLSTVLSFIAEICEEKAEHVASNWQDTDEASKWTHATGIVERAVERVAVRLGL